MKSQLLSISLSLLFFPARYTEKKDAASLEKKNSTTYSITNNAEVLYNDLHLSDAGLSQKAFEYAYKGYQYLIKKGKLNNTSLLSICDLSQSSSKKRFYILDLSDNKVLLTSYVAHGKGSGAEYATHFSNRANSHQSSLGFYITGSPYYGEHGLSLKLEGLEAGFNDHATRRNIVIHGAKYVGDGRLDGNQFMGRSYGCPAVPQNESGEIINMIKNGSCLFIYHPTKIYLQRSRILNG
ncbi:MAG: murein L,D-transpeptidase catalytic domain family protein [Chitinophagales bacterium]